MEWSNQKGGKEKAKTHKSRSSAPRVKGEGRGSDKSRPRFFREKKKIKRKKSSDDTYWPNQQPEKKKSGS